MKKYLFSWHLGALFQKQVRNINFVYQQISVNDVKASENTIGRKREVGRIYEDWRYLETVIFYILMLPLNIYT